MSIKILFKLKKIVTNFKNYLEETIFTLNDLLNVLKLYENIINSQIIDYCHHEKVDDYIDISPELSQKITYCIKCEKTC